MKFQGEKEKNHLKEIQGEMRSINFMCNFEAYNGEK